MRGDNFMESKKIKVNQLVFIGEFDLSNILSLEEIQDLLEKYYDKNYKVINLMNQFNLNISSLNFAKYLPYLRTERKCIYDQSFMIKKLPSRSSSSYESKIYRCPECQHVESTLIGRQSCDCDNCKELEKENENKKIQQLAEKRKKIETIILTSRKFWKYEELTLNDRIMLATILQNSQSKSGEEIVPYQEYGENDSNTILKMVSKLLGKGILSIDTSTSLDAFEEENEGIKYYLEKIKLMIPLQYEQGISKETQFERLKYPNYKDLSVTNKDKICRVWREYVTDELLILFDQFLVEFKFEDMRKDTTDKKESSILRWLENYTPAQIYSAMWAGVRNANTQRTQGHLGKYKFHPVHFVIFMIDKHMTEKVTLKDYNYPKNQVMSLSKKIFFESILHKVNWFKMRVPTTSDLKLDIEYYQVDSQQFEEQEKRLAMFEIDTTKIKEIVDNTLEYNILPVGISILDSDGRWSLYTDELTLWQISNSMDVLPIKKTIEYESNEYWIDCLLNVEQLLRLTKELLATESK